MTSPSEEGAPTGSFGELSVSASSFWRSTLLGASVSWLGTARRSCR
jgi:hypothetical protein